MISGNYRDLLFGSKSGCFASKTHWRELEPIEASISDAKHAVLHALNHRWGLGHIETCNSCPMVAVLIGQNHRWALKPIETCNSGPKVALLNVQNNRWGLGPMETSNSYARHGVLHACLYGSQPSSVVLCNLKSDLRTRIACPFVSQTSPVI